MDLLTISTPRTEGSSQMPSKPSNDLYNYPAGDEHQQLNMDKIKLVTQVNDEENGKIEEFEKNYKKVVFQKLAN
jgi:hypothetical protein